MTRFALIDVDESADAFDLNAADVHWALAYETSALSGLARLAKPATVPPPSTLTCSAWPRSSYMRVRT